MDRLLPKNWTRKTHKERKIPGSSSASAEYETDFPELSARQGARGSRTQNVRQRGITSCLSTDVQNYQTTATGMSYKQWKANLRDSIWMQCNDRTPLRIRPVNRRCLRQMAKEFARHYRERGQFGNHCGSTDDEMIRMVGDEVEIYISSGSTDDKEFKYLYLSLVEELLGPVGSDEEYKNFIQLIKISSWENFWMLEYHPILMSIGERIFFPTDTLLALQNTGDWFENYWNFVKGNFFEKTCKITENLAGKVQGFPVNHKFLSVFKKNMRKHEFEETCVGVLNLFRVLVDHGSDYAINVPHVEVEREFSNRFPQMWIYLFSYVFLYGVLDENLNYLLNRRPPISEY